MKHLFTVIILLLSLLPATPSRGSERENINEVEQVLKRLDKEIARRNEYLWVRGQRIDSLKRLIAGRNHDQARLKIVVKLGDTFAPFNNDSALNYYDEGYRTSISAGLDSFATVFKMRRAVCMALAGLNGEAIDELHSINRDSLINRGGPLVADFFNAERQLHSYIVAAYRNHLRLRLHHESKVVDAQKLLLARLDSASVDYKYNLGEYYYNTGDFSKATVLLKEIVDSLDEGRNMFARAANQLASISRAQGDDDAYIYYLGLSAIGDIKSATLEVSSLQALGRELFERGQHERAYLYLTTALENAVNCHAVSRMMESAEALPTISEAHKRELEHQNDMLYMVITLMAILLILLIAAMIYLRADMKRLDRLQRRLQKANVVKEFYISQFLNLSSIYMDKLNEFCKIANRKISTGKVDDLYKLTKSGKFVEEQSREFYEVFDNAFLHLYPTFVDDVNSLLRDDSKITLGDGEMMNTGLRILALLRLGIDDCSHIARVLNYSVNTIYAYRNKMKNRAINRESFEDSVLEIGKVK